MRTKDTQLPHQPIQWFTDQFIWFTKIQSMAAAVLLFATTVALALSNSSFAEGYLGFWETQIGFHIGSFDMSRSLQAWINDGVMTLFFFVVALELKREFVLGELRKMRMAFLPLAGAVGGMVFPALCYLIMTRGHPEAHGWGVVMATDTAFLLGSLALLGSHVPPSLRLFLLSLVIFDDVGAVVVVALGYGHSLNWMVLGLGLLGLCIVAGASRLGIRLVAIYSGLGVLIWFCFDSSGVHPTLVGVVLGLMAPARGWVSDARMRAIFEKVLSYPTGEHWSGDTADRHHLGQASLAARETLSPLERIEMRLHPWVGFLVMPLFALANAGVAISENVFKNPVSVAIIVSLVCGKPMGVFVVSWLSVRLGVASMLPNLNWSLIAAGSILTGIGFTMSLFIADLAFEATSLLNVKAGILMASVIAASLGLFALFFLTRGTQKTA